MGGFHIERPKHLLSNNVRHELFHYCWNIAVCNTFCVRAVSLYFVKKFIIMHTLRQLSRIMIIVFRYYFNDFNVISILKY